MASPTGRAVRNAGRMQDANGHSVILAVDCDGVVIRRGGKEILLGPAERDLFSRLYFDAEVKAEAWATEHAGAGDGPSLPATQAEYAARVAARQPAEWAEGHTGAGAADG